MASRPVLQFYAELQDYEPKIWRRFQVQDSITYARLGYIIMTLFEMEATHLFCMDIPKKKVHYELPPSDMFCGEYDRIRGDRADEAKLFNGFVKPGDEIIFTYDFGAEWKITIKLEKSEVDNETYGREFPKVVDGEGYGIIEKCAGVDGLKNYSGEIDLTKFDIKDMAFRVKKVPRIYRDLYECDYAPSKRAIDILNRKYDLDKI